MSMYGRYACTITLFDQDGCYVAEGTCPDASTPQLAETSARNKLIDMLTGKGMYGRHYWLRAGDTVTATTQRLEGT